jgi:hypothetical protein
MVVRHEFEKAGVNPLEVNMGEVTLCKPISDNQLKKIDKRLTELGFEILDDKNKKLFERAKAILIKKVQTDEIEEYFSLGDYLPKKLIKNTHS